MEEKENEGLSLGDIFGIIWNRKIWVAAVTGAVLIITILVILFFYNPRKATYTSDFEYSFIGSENEEYPSGKVFNYKDIISEESLEKVIQSDSKYSFLNAKDLYSKNKITITRIENRTSENQVSNPNQYRITVQGVKNDNDNVIALFINDLLKNSVAIVRQDINEIDYTSVMDSYLEYDIYDTAIDFLQEQYAFLVQSYNDLIATYSMSYMVGGKNLQQYLNEINVYFSRVNLNSLKVEVNENHYVKNVESYLKYVNREIADLNEKIKDNKAIIEALRTEIGNISGEYNPGSGMISDNSFAAFNNRIATLTEENARYEIRKGILEKFIEQDVTTNEEFEKSINDIYLKMREFVSQLEENVKSIDSSRIKVAYSVNSVVEQSGKMGIPMAIVIGLVLGLVLSCVVVFVLEFSSRNKKEEKQEEEVKA